MFNLPLYILAETKLSDATAAVTFTLADYTIPSWAVHLAILVSARDTGSVVVSSPKITFNGDTTTKYHQQYLRGDGSTADTSNVDSNAALTQPLRIPGVSATGGASAFGGGMIVIPEYANTARDKLTIGIGGAAEESVHAAIGRYDNTVAITSITLTANSTAFAANSRFTLAVVDERYSIRSETLSGVGTFDHQNIPALDDLAYLAVLRGVQAATSIAINIALNNDTTTSNYAMQQLVGSASSTSAAAASVRELGVTSAASLAANLYGVHWGFVNQFAKGDNDPHIFMIGGAHDVGASFMRATSMRRNNVEAVNRFSLTPSAGTNWAAGSSLWLYRSPKAYTQRVVVTAGGGAATITFSDIPQDGDALVVTLYGRDDASAALTDVDIELNDDATSANYDMQELSGDGTTVAAAQSAADEGLLAIPGDSATANIYGGLVGLIADYAQTDRHKHIVTIGGGAQDIVELRSLRWENTDAITKLELKLAGGNSFKQNTIAEISVIHNLSFQNTTINTRTRST